MKKSIIFVLAALVALAMMSCSTSTYKGIDSNGVISFNSIAAILTKAELVGATAATKLNNEFVVWGEKGTEAETETAGEKVFVNYKVGYVSNTANTTQSNSKNWEYVALNKYAATAFNTSDDNAFDSEEQFIKYWDYSANHYTFTAISSNEIDGTKVKVVKTVTGTTTGAVGKYEKGYVLTLNGANLDNLYVADRVEIAEGTGTDRNAVNAYGGNVTFKFRKPYAKVRVGFYENLPGYSVQITGFKVVDSDAPTFADMKATSLVDAAFKANFVSTVLGLSNTTPAEDKTMTITYFDNTSAYENQPKIITDIASNNVLTLGANVLNNTLSEVSNAPTYDQDGGAFSYVLNKIDNTQSLKLCLTYVLTSVDGSGEHITVKDATAEIPANFMAWKNNYAYTYLFKISDNTNGATKPGVEGLYPITFDGCLIDTEDGLQETITTVAEPSITTYAEGKVVTANNEYKTSKTIYATVENNSALATMVAWSANPSLLNAASYFILSNTANPGVDVTVATEADILAALQYQVSNDGSVITGRNGIVLTKVATALDVTTVPGIDKAFTAGQVASYTPAAAGRLAFVYTKTAQTATENIYDQVPFAVSDAVPAGHYVVAKTTIDAASVGADKAVADKLYFKKNLDDSYTFVKTVVGVTDVTELYEVTVPAALAADGTATADTYYFTKYVETDGEYQAEVIKVVV